MIILFVQKHFLQNSDLKFALIRKCDIDLPPVNNVMYAYPPLLTDLMYNYPSPVHCLSFDLARRIKLCTI